MDEMIQNKTAFKSREIIRELEGKQTDDFWGEAALSIQKTVQTHYVLIGKLIESDLSKVQTLAFAGEGKLFPSLVYNLYETPCENVVNREMCYYPCKVVDLFPNDKELKDLQVDSYLGAPLLNEKGEAVGLIALMHREAMPGKAENAEILESISVELSKRMPL